jgi:hypothetical protein
MTDLVEGSHAARSTLGGSPFPPIADYGFLSDREVSALVAPGGNVGPWRHGSTRSETHQRAPVDHSAERVLLRTAFLPPEDKRVRSTVLAIADELTENELVLRYHVEETDDGFSGEEGSTPRRSTRIPDVTSGTSRRPSPTWRSSTRSST